MGEPIFLKGMLPGQVSDDGTGLRFGFKTDGEDLMLETNHKAIEEIIFRLQQLTAQAAARRGARTPGAASEAERPTVRFLLGEDRGHMVLELVWAGRPPAAIPLDERGMEDLMKALKSARDLLRQQSKPPRH